jgi:hypothetical protein
MGLTAFCGLKWGIKPEVMSATVALTDRVLGLFTKLLFDPEDSTNAQASWTA